MEIPLPPLQVQKEILAEIEGYQEEIRNYALQITNFEVPREDSQGGKQSLGQR